MRSRVPAALLCAVASVALGACGSKGAAPASVALKPQLPFPPRAMEPGSGAAKGPRPAGRIIRIGGRPEGVAIDPRTHTIGVGTDDPAQLVLLDSRTDRVRARVKLPGAPRHVVLARPGGPFLVPSEDADELVQVDPASARITARTKVGDNPHNAAYQDGAAYVTNEFDSTLSEVRDGRLVRTIPVDAQPGGVEALPHGQLATISVRAYTIEVLDRARRRLGAQNVGYGPSHAVVDARGRVFVMDTRGGGISVFDTSPRLRFVARLPLSGTPYGAAIDVARRRLWVTRPALDRVSELDVSGARPRVVRTFPTAQSAFTVAVDPASGDAVVASRATGTLQRITP